MKTEEKFTKKCFESGASFVFIPSLFLACLTSSSDEFKQKSQRFINKYTNLLFLFSFAIIN